MIVPSKSIPHQPFPIDNPSGFNNYVLIALVVVVPFFVTRLLPFLFFSFSTSYVLVALITGLPITVGYWMGMSYLAEMGKDTSTVAEDQKKYLTFNDAAVKAQYAGKRIPMTDFHDLYFDGKINVNGDMLEVLEQRHKFISYHFTVELFKYVFLNLIPDVLVHSPSQDEEQVRDHYDRGDDFYSWFLGPRMIYTSGVMKSEEKETLEQMQDNKLALVCHKLELKPTDKLLDVGCGWGTLSAYAGRNFGCDVTGITLGKNQTIFGNKRIKDNGVDPSRARILCKDYREIGTDVKYNKIVSLEMAEHVGVRRYTSFMKQMYDLLEDDGIFVLQVAGIRPHWQFEDLIWGLFMNKYVFPGADASCALNWVIAQVEGVGFEVKSVDVLGVHYAATLWRWYENWKSNEELVVAKYGIRWYKIWLYFLASAVITSRQGSVSVFQIVLHKNINNYPRANGVASHTSLFFTPETAPTLIV